MIGGRWRGLAPTAIISWAHTDPDMDADQTYMRKQQVIRLATALRELGIDAELDLYHLNEDWTRWGPSEIARSDYVLIIASSAWKAAWEGRGDEDRNKGVRAEANAVRSIEQLGRSALQKQCRLILLPGSDDTHIPNELHGLQRYRIDPYENAELEDLLRDLTDQPRYVKHDPGSIPLFPPELMDFPRPHGPSSEPDSLTLLHAEPDLLARVEDRLPLLKAQLGALPEPLPGESNDLQWYRARLDIHHEIEALTNPEPPPANAESTLPIRSEGLVRSEGLAVAPRRQFRDRVQGYAYLRSEFISDASYFISTEHPFCSLMMIDIDHLTQINRVHGTAVGDAVLVSCLQLLGLVQELWTHGRCGDDTFFGVLGHRGLASARQVAVRFCQGFKTHDWEQISPELRVTCSIGFVEADLAESTDDTVARAVAGFRKAKKEGGNQVRFGPRYLPPMVSDALPQPVISAWASDIARSRGTPDSTSSTGSTWQGRRSWDFS